MPRIAALRNTFSRPDSSGWKPAPSSSSADIRLCTRTRACVRLEDAGHALQQRRLARAVLADDAEDLALLDVERHVLERDELVVTRCGPWRRSALRRVGLLAVEAERLGEVVDLECQISHGYISSAKRGDSLLKIHVPKENVPNAKTIR